MNQQVLLSSTSSKTLWLKRLDHIIGIHLQEADLSNEVLASQLSLSKRHLIRRVKQLTGLSPQQYIRQYRLQQAMVYLKSGQYTTVKATATAIGYTNISYFIRQFEQQFGRKPLKVLQEAGWR